MQGPSAGEKGDDGDRREPDGAVAVQIAREMLTGHAMQIVHEMRIARKVRIVRVIQIAPNARSDRAGRTGRAM